MKKRFQVRIMVKSLDSKTFIWKIIGLYEDYEQALHISNMNHKSEIFDFATEHVIFINS